MPSDVSMEKSRRDLPNIATLVVRVFQVSEKTRLENSSEAVCCLLTRVIVIRLIRYIIRHPANSEGSARAFVLILLILYRHLLHIVVLVRVLLSVLRTLKLLRSAHPAAPCWRCHNSHFRSSFLTVLFDRHFRWQFPLSEQSNGYEV